MTNEDEKGISDNEDSDNECEKFKVEQIKCKFEEGPDKDEQPVLFRRQILAACTMILLVIVGSMVAGYSGILLPQLAQPESTIKLNKNQESWIAAMAPLLMSIGCVFSSWSMDKFGRKASNLACTTLALFGWATIYYSNNLTTLLIGRVICGLYVGLSGMSTTAYIAEIADTKYRGLFLSFVALGIALGVLIVHIMGTFLHWQTVALVTMAGPLVLICLVAYLPESHVWYINRGKLEKARRSFYWFRGHGLQANEELERMIEKSAGPKKSLLEVISECKRQEFYKPLMILFLFFTTTQVTGTNVVTFYSVSLMQMTVPSLDKYAAMIIVDVIRVIVSIVASILTQRYKVRVLLFTSVVGTVCSLFLLSVFVHLGQVYPDEKTYTTIPLVFLISYIVFVSIGLVPLPWTVLGEVLPPVTKGIGGGMACAVNFLAFFIVIKTSPNLFEALGAVGTFGLYGGLVMIGGVGLYFVLPETKNRTLQDIQEFFKPVPRANSYVNCDMIRGVK